MDFYDVINSRRSVRAYKNDPIPKDALERIGQAVREAPSACGLQPWRFRIILNPETRKKICSVYTRPWLAQAPAIAAAIGDKESCWKRLDGRPAVDIDTAIAMEHLVLAASAENLGTCWICAYDVPQMDAVLGVSSPWTTVAITPVGYPAEPPGPARRKPLAEIFQVED
jgi:nitroreductase